MSRPVHQVEIRVAGPVDAERLRRIAADAKGYWGYEPERVRDWAAGLDLSALGDVYVALVDGHVTGWAGLLPPTDGVCVLEDLWIEPEWIGKRIGTELFRVAAARARELGAHRMEWEAEPNAVGFYEKMGGGHVRDQLSSWGRVLAVMGVDLD